MSSPTAQRRSRLFVDWKLQGGIVFRILLHWVSFVAVGTIISCVIRWFTHPTQSLASQADAMLAQFGPFLVTMLAMLPIFVLDTVKLTNRFAGPFVRFRRQLTSVRQGRPPQRLTFRDGDYWLETQEDLNAVFDELNQLRQEAAARRPEAGQPPVSACLDDVTLSELAGSSLCSADRSTPDRGSAE